VALKFGRIENFAPLKPKVPVSLWVELCTMVCWGSSLHAVIRGITTGGKRGTIPRVPNYCGGARKVLTMPQVLQCSTFAFERPQVRTRGRQTCFLPRAPS